jgi:hypothetical protein
VLWQQTRAYEEASLLLCAAAVDSVMHRPAVICRGGLLLLLLLAPGCVLLVRTATPARPTNCWMNCIQTCRAPAAATLLPENTRSNTCYSSYSI